MDWAEDCTGIGEADFQRVWRYDNKATTVVHLTSKDEVHHVSPRDTQRPLPNVITVPNSTISEDEQ